ncbi:MAG: ABC transporter ATP-binding protein [Bdellovibrionales bacterium]
MLQIKNLKKTYKGNVHAVNGINLNIPLGSCFGLLGPNGAGKSTTIEIIEGIKEATSGEILLNSKPIDESFKQIIGIQFQETVLHDFMTVKEALELFSTFYTKTIPIPEIIKMCYLEEYLNQYTNKISGGQRQRLLLGIALINDPEIIFLDEPTTGLDPQSRRNFWDLINSIKKKKKTILLTTHYMEEAFQLCDEIAIVDKGMVIAQGNPKNLLAQHYDGASISLDQALMESVPKELNYQLDGSQRIKFHTSELNETLKILIEKGIDLSSMEIHKHSLEDLFVDITGKQLRD